MQVVGSGDRDGVDHPGVQHLAIIGKSGAPAFQCMPAYKILVDIGNRGELGRIASARLPEMLSADAFQTDDTIANSHGRGYYDFDSGAKLLDWGAHTVDLCQWANQSDDTMPIEYEPAEKKITARYANGVKLVLDFLETPFGKRPGWIQHLGTCPVRFVGDEGWVEVGDSGGIEVHPASLKSELQQLPKKVRGLDVSAHARNFFDCIKSREATAANPQVMRHSHIASHAAALAWILNRKLRLDPAKEAFIDDDEANSLRSRPARDPWSV